MSYEKWPSAADLPSPFLAHGRERPRRGKERHVGEMANRWVEIVQNTFVVLENLVLEYQYLCLAVGWRKSPHFAATLYFTRERRGRGRTVGRAHLVEPH